MTQVKTIGDALTTGDGNAIVIFTKGKEDSLDLKHIGESRTGDWKINKDRKFETVLIYHRGDNENENTIFKGKFSRLEDSKSVESRSTVFMEDVVRVGDSSSNWYDFTGINRLASPIMYVNTEVKTTEV